MDEDILRKLEERLGPLHARQRLGIWTEHDGANLRPRSPLLSHRELVSGPFCHSKRTEVDRSLLAEHAGMQNA